MIKNIVITCIYNNDNTPEYQCCNCNHIFDHKPIIGEKCSGCNNRIIQIEVL